MKFLARHVILDADQAFPIYEVAEGENLAQATEILANKVQKTTILRVSYDPERGVVVINSGSMRPNDGAILQNWPEGEPMQGDTQEPTVSA